MTGDAPRAGARTARDRPRPPPTPSDAAPTAARADAGRSRARRRGRRDRKPDTGDAAEDGYTYGYRLWTAKLYPEAATALKPVADKYPKHRRASFAQNLLGRAYLDDGKPSLASLAFYDSYKKFPDGERAPDSLFYLAQALVKLKKPAADVCKVYAELTDVYGDEALRGDEGRRREGPCRAEVQVTATLRLRRARSSLPSAGTASVATVASPTARPAAPNGAARARRLGRPRQHGDARAGASRPFPAQSSPPRSITACAPDRPTKPRWSPTIAARSACRTRS